MIDLSSNVIIARSCGRSSAGFSSEINIPTSCSTSVIASHICLLAMVAAALLGARVAQAQVVPITIVSVGDSYASGEGAPDEWGPFAEHPIWRGDNSDGMAADCHRSNLAAPAAAARLVGKVRRVRFVHLACSGAKIADVIASGGQLASAGRLVSVPIDALIVSIGGNDIHFSNIVADCLIAPCEGVTPASFPAAAFSLTSGLAALTSSVRALPVPVRHVFITEYPDPS